MNRTVYTELKFSVGRASNDKRRQAGLSKLFARFVRSAMFGKFS